MQETIHARHRRCRNSTDSSCSLGSMRCGDHGTRYSMLPCRTFGPRRDGAVVGMNGVGATPALARRRGRCQHPYIYIYIHRAVSYVITQKTKTAQTRPEDRYKFKEFLGYPASSSFTSVSPHAHTAVCEIHGTLHNGELFIAT